MAGPDDLEVKIKITVDQAEVALAEKVAQEIVRVRAILANSASSTSAFVAERDALRDALNDELRFIKEAVAQKVATEEEGQRERLAILQRYAAKFEALNAQFNQPLQGPAVPPGFFAAATATPEPVKTPEGLKATTEATVAATQAQGEFILSLEQGRAITAEVGNDFVKFTAAVIKLKEAFEAEQIAAQNAAAGIAKVGQASQDNSLTQQVAQEEVRLRAIINSPASSTSAFKAESDALRAAVNEELRITQEAVAQKAATEQEGLQSRLEILQRYAVKFAALNAQFSQPNQAVAPGPGFFARGQAETAKAPAGLADVVAQLGAATVSHEKFTLSLEQSRSIMSQVGNDYDRFSKVVLKLKEAFEAEQVAAQNAAQAAGKLPQQVVTTSPQGTTQRPEAPVGQRLGPELPPGWLQQANAATAATNQAAAANQNFVLTTELVHQVMTEVGGDYDKFRQKILQLQLAHNQAAAAARGEAIAEADVGGKLLLFGKAADATFQQVPRGARTAANGLSILALSAQSSTGGVTSAVRAVGNLAFGLSTLSTSANVVAGAAGIGAVVTIMATLIELFIRGTEKTREQDAALKSFIQTQEAFAERAKATAAVVASIRQATGVDPKIEFVGITKQVDDLHKALLKIQDDTKKAFARFSIAETFAADIPGVAEELIKVQEEVTNLKKKILDGTITNEKFTEELARMSKAFPHFSDRIIEIGQLGANFIAATEAIREFSAQARQVSAEKISLKAFFGDTPDLAREADEANKRLIEIQRGGPIAALALENERQAMIKAQEAWKQYVDSKRGSQFADIAFRDALEANDRARTAVQLRLNADLKTRNATQIEVTAALNAAQREAFSKLTTAFNTIQTDQEAQNTPGAIDALRKSNADILKLRAERLRGEVEAQKIAARSESDLTIKRLQENTALEVQGGRIRNQLIANERERLRIQLLKIDEDAARALIQASTQTGIDLAKKQASAETALLNISKDEDERALKAKLNARQITQTEFNEQTLAREIKFSNDLLEIQRRSIDAQSKLLSTQLQTTPNLKPEEKTKIKGQITDLEEEKRKAEADAADRTARAVGTNLENTAALSKKVTDETEQAQIDILRLTGHAAEASALDIKKKFRDLIAELKAIGGPGSQKAIDIVVQLQGLAAAKSEMEGLQSDVGEKLDFMQARLNQIHVQIAAHAITEREARQQIVAAELQAADAIEASLPALEKQAAILRDRKSAEQVLLLKTRLFELRDEIRRNSDDFFRLKEVIRDSTQNAIEGILIQAPQVAFGNKGQQDEINTLKEHAQSAKDELQRLLALPTSDRTDVVNNRITELRKEIDGVTDSINNAKSAIDGWKNLFIRAIDSILDAMLKLEAQMIAQIALEKISSLGRIIFGATKVAGAVATAGTGVDVPDFATGGPVFGPGTTTSDSIPARLSNKEFVEPATATEYYGFSVFEMLRRRMIPRELMHFIAQGIQPLSVRTVTAHRPFAAEGGLVSIPQQAQASAAQPDSKTHLIVEAGEDTTVRVMSSTRGAKITLRHIEDNIEGLRALLGV